jgi:hypothetical protein
MLETHIAAAWKTPSGYFISIIKVSLSIFPNINESFHYFPPNIKFFTDAFFTIPLKSNL